ncbi:MAG: DUF2330 domain-containing protein [Myxococcales bacterium]
MIRSLVIAFAVALLVPQAALACGGFYGQSVEVAPNQKIVVVHRDGIETYLFRPNFCGSGKEFGVILPIPATLTESPSLGSNALFDELDRFTEPKKVEVCQPIGCGGGGGTNSDRAAGYEVPGSTGVNVIKQGRVGQFDYVLLQASTVAAFTDWLDANGFPHAASEAYDSYVQRKWYFVGFKVTASTTDPPQGKKLCGDLGPIQLSFASESAIVPARIAAINTVAGSGYGPIWRVFLVGPGQKRIATSSFTETLYFAGALRPSELSAQPTLASLARENERLTAIDVSFPSGGSTEDIVFEDAPTSDFRTTKEVYVDCIGGCGATDSRSLNLVVVVGAVLALFLTLRRRA